MDLTISSRSYLGSLYDEHAVALFANARSGPSVGRSLAAKAAQPFGPTQSAGDQHQRVNRAPFAIFDMTQCRPRHAGACGNLLLFEPLTIALPAQLPTKQLLELPCRTLFGTKVLISMHKNRYSINVPMLGR